MSDKKIQILIEKYADVLSNQNIYDIGEWTQKNFDDKTDEEAYLKRAKSEIHSLKEKIFKVVDNININE